MNGGRLPVTWSTPVSRWSELRPGTKFWIGTGWFIVGADTYLIVRGWLARRRQQDPSRWATMSVCWGDGILNEKYGKLLVAGWGLLTIHLFMNFAPKKYRRRKG